MLHLSSPSGLRIELNEHGGLHRIDFDDLLVNLFPGNEIEAGPANLYLRRRDRRMEWTPLLGPSCCRHVATEDRGFRVDGEWDGVVFRVSLSLAADAPVWAWCVDVENRRRRRVSLDVVHCQDFGLAYYDFARLNEYYVSQYLDFTPLQQARHGVALAVRQNLAMDGRNPWAVIGSLQRAVGFATDALQLCAGEPRRAAATPALGRRMLPNRRLQHEHALAVLQSEAVQVAPGGVARFGFFGMVTRDHPAATCDADVTWVDTGVAAARRLRSVPAPPSGRLRDADEMATKAPVSTVFSRCPVLDGADLAPEDLDLLFGAERRHAEHRAGRLLSFFIGPACHVVLREKEMSVLRPHGHILRTGSHRTPDEASLTSTVWMAGVFNSLLTQGHVGINRFLSATRGYLGFFRAHGQRIFVEVDGRFLLLGIPSAFAMEPGRCRWIYQREGELLEVTTVACADRHEIEVQVRAVRGRPARLLWSHYLSWNGNDGPPTMPTRIEREGDAIAVRPPLESEVGRRFPDGSFRITPGAATQIERVGGDEMLFADGRTRRQPFVTILTAPSAVATLRIEGRLLPPVASRADLGAAERRLPTFRCRGENRNAASVGRLSAIVPWLEHDAMIHYLAPRGLEQFSGGGWGTRDVCQGPVEMLLSFGMTAAVRDLLLRVFAAQNPDGDWPQWFTFFERDRQIRAGEAHGDVVFWPLLALGRYLVASGDASILEETVPFFSPQATSDFSPSVWDHVERALAIVETRLVPGTHLPMYGRGDWNDALQPVDPEMRQSLCSAWTVTLYHDALRSLAAAFEDSRPALAQRFAALASSVCDEFQRLLVPDGVVAGFASFQRQDGRIDYLLHPRDAVTGIHYRLLPMIHAVAGDMLTPAQAARHLELIEKHLLGRDGARLFDRPPAYRGGPQRVFQRAESSTFFGREIGLMYMHAHLRYAQATARYGDATAFFRALCQANPIGLNQWVRGARPRQFNCFYSSSDAAFPDRYAAAARYGCVVKGGVRFEGGWRIYSSGAGIMLRLLQEGLLGIRRGAARLAVDPVLPPSLDGMQANLEIDGYPVTVTYRVGRRGCGPTGLALNGARLDFERERNPYRPGGAIVPMSELRAHLLPNENGLTVHVG